MTKLFPPNYFCKFTLLVPLLACLGAIIYRQRLQCGFQPALFSSVFSYVQSGVCDLRGLISGFFWGCWLVFFHIAILLGESLLFFAPMFSFVIGWQNSSTLMGNDSNAPQP